MSCLDVSPFAQMASHFAQMVSLFAQNSTTTFCSLFSCHTPLLAICTYKNAHPPNPKTQTLLKNSPPPKKKPPLPPTPDPAPVSLRRAQRGKMHFELSSSTCREPTLELQRKCCSARAAALCNGENASANALAFCVNAATEKCGEHGRISAAE